MQNLKEKQEGTIHAILAGLLLNGFIQGETKEKLDDKPLDFAKKEFDKILDKVRKETAKYVCDKMIGKEYHPCPINSFDDGWNERIKEEKEIKKQIIKELK